MIFFPLESIIFTNGFNMYENTYFNLSKAFRSFKVNIILIYYYTKILVILKIKEKYPVIY